MKPGTRQVRIMTGLITIILGAGSIYLGVKVAVGALRPKYQLNAIFSAAGQGLISGSDVKIHGVNVGKVKNVKLVRGRARVRMDFERGERVPVGAKATIRPKTLFGEKFVDIDPGPNEAHGPFFTDEQEIPDTVGGFELERVLADLYPILKAVRPEDLTVVLDTLAGAGDGMGPAVNRQIVAFSELADVTARHDADLRQFLADLAALSGTLADRADDIVAMARSLNTALPPLNSRSDELTAVLEQAARLSAEVANLLDANQPFFEKAVTKGGQAVQVIYDRRAQLPSLVTGLRQFFEVLASVGHVPYGDGTRLAGVKFVMGEDCPNGRYPTCTPPPSGAARTGGATEPADKLDGRLPDSIPSPIAGADGIADLLGGLLP